MNNVLTASGQNTFLSCARKYFWQNEIGLRKNYYPAPGGGREHALMMALVL